MTSIKKSSIFTAITHICIALSLLCASSAFSEKKNILFLIVDDMNDWIEPYGGHPQAQTPNMSKFAKDALVFKHAYCSSPLCRPSRTSILTGLRPTTSGVYNFDPPQFRKIKNGRFANLITLPQHFQNNGYISIKDGKVYHEWNGTSDPASWNESELHTGTSIPEGINKASDVHGMVFPRPWHNYKYGLYWGPCVEKTLEETGDGVAAQYIIDKLNGFKGSNTNFFLAYGISKPHLPWLVPQKYFDAFSLDSIIVPKLRKNELEGIPLPEKSNNEQSVFDKNPGKYKEGVRAYLACIKFADDCLGRVLDALEASPYKSNTIVCIMGDHGWHLGEKMHWGKNTLWEESIKTPLMIYDPSMGRNNGREIDQVVSLQDLYLTLSELAGTTKVPDYVEGRSFASIFKDPNDKSWLGWAVASGTFDTNDRVLRTDKWSLIRYGTVGNYQFELYDMQNDPLQYHNMANRNGDICRKLSLDIDLICAGKEPQYTDLYR